MKKKFLLISLLIIYFSNLFANEKVFFEEGKNFFLEKSMTMQNSNLKKILFSILKMKNLIYI